MQERAETELRHAVHEQATHIAIDGPATSGKSTVGKGLSERLRCSYLDTGLMYRAITLLALEQNLSPDSEGDVLDLARSVTFTLAPASHDAIVVNQRLVGRELRTPRVDAHVSAVSAHPGVREVLVKRQRELADGRCIVMVGRDIGTVVMPDAPVKLWVTASSMERARRRFDERLDAANRSVDDVRAEIEARDRRDTGREVSPLRRAEDAVTLATDAISPARAGCEAALIVAGRILWSGVRYGPLDR